MAELAVRDGLPPPTGLPTGEFICTRLPDGTIRIDHADPRILISAELLDTIPDGSVLGSWLDLAACTIDDGHGYTDAVLRISAVNRQVIYRITSYVPRVNAYIGEWPD